MERREVLRALAVLAITPRWLQAQQNTNAAPVLPAPVPWTQGLNPLTPLPHTVAEDAVAQTVPAYFSSTQRRTLSRLADALVPRTAQHPGALDAGTPEFLDFLIGHSPAARGGLYTSGLDWLEAQAQASFKRPFAQLDAAQVESLVKPWLRTWMTDHPPTQTHADFINIAHADIRTATINSQVWFAALDAHARENTLQLYWSPIEPDLYAMRPESMHTRPVPGNLMQPVRPKAE
ncbi:MAG: gluconate 2-dehydrogenase subunit 3 family protein [Acidobacteriota bacterium]|nr:gluconate 2-dehydrogenase subunit 3 family protein [Acidobacteriota bacterium]